MGKESSKTNINHIELTEKTNEENNLEGCHMYADEPGYITISEFEQNPQIPTYDNVIHQQSSCKFSKRKICLIVTCVAFIVVTSIVTVLCSSLNYKKHNNENITLTINYSVGNTNTDSDDLKEIMSKTTPTFFRAFNISLSGKKKRGKKKKHLTSKNNIHLEDLKKTVSKTTPEIFTEFKNIPLSSKKKRWKKKEKLFYEKLNTTLSGKKKQWKKKKHRTSDNNIHLEDLKKTMSNTTPEIFTEFKNIPLSSKKKRWQKLIHYLEKQRKNMKLEMSCRGYSFNAKEFFLKDFRKLVDFRIKTLNKGKTFCVVPDRFIVTNTYKVMVISYCRNCILTYNINGQFVSAWKKKHPNGICEVFNKDIFVATDVGLIVISGEAMIAITGKKRYSDVYYYEDTVFALNADSDIVEMYKYMTSYLSAYLNPMVSGWKYESSLIKPCGEGMDNFIIHTYSYANTRHWSGYFSQKTSSPSYNGAYVQNNKEERLQSCNSQDGYFAELAADTLCGVNEDIMQLLFIQNHQLLATNSRPEGSITDKIVNKAIDEHIHDIILYSYNVFYLLRGSQSGIMYFELWMI